MSKSDQVNDTYNPPSVSTPLFEEMLFSEVEVEDLFWLKDGGVDNPPYRKTDESQGGNTQTRVLQSFNPRTKVFQRT